MAEGKHRRQKAHRRAGIADKEIGFRRWKGPVTALDQESVLFFVGADQYPECVQRLCHIAGVVAVERSNEFR